MLSGKMGSELDDVEPRLGKKLECKVERLGSSQVLVGHATIR
jgi:hypothetical protein